MTEPERTRALQGDEDKRRGGGSATSLLISQIRRSSIGYASTNVTRYAFDGMPTAQQSKQEAEIADLPTQLPRV